MVLQNGPEKAKRKSTCEMGSVGIALNSLGASPGGDCTGLGFVSCLHSRIALDKAKIDP